LVSFVNILYNEVTMKELIGFVLLSGVKIFSHLFFRGEFFWPEPKPRDPFDVKLIVFLNHTSLYEPLYLQAAPFSFLWKLTRHVHVPGADITLNRPLVGRFWKMLFPRISTITRKKDESWELFLKQINSQSIIAIAPEGRMKRLNGLDKFGKKMTVRGGVADIIERLGKGRMLICLSGGLHHVQTPGIMIPKLFKTIQMRFEVIEIEEYLQSFSKEPKRRKLEIIQDLQRRLDEDCPPPLTRL